MLCKHVRGIVHTLIGGALLSACGWLLGNSALADVTHSSGVLGKGTPWETAYYTQTSDRSGPTVVISGGSHGDEPAGAAAAEQIRHWPIRCGTLAVLPRANPPALAARRRNIPNAPPDLANLNRCFPKAKVPGPAAGEQAQAIWNWVQQQQPAWVLDLHEGSGVRGAGSKSVGSSVIVQPLPQTESAVERMLEAVNATIDDPRKKFVRLGPSVDGSLARAAGEHLGAGAMTLETSINAPASVADPAKDTKPAAAVKPQRQPLSLRVRQHRILVHALLANLGMIDPSLNVDTLPGKETIPDKTHVALYDAGGTGGEGAPSLERILTGAGMRVTRCGPAEIVAGTLDRFHLVIFPGGSGSKQAAAIGPEGRAHVRRFVEQGGGYLGVCAGAYLCTGGYDWSLKILDAKTVSPKWERGRATLQMELTERGRQWLGDRSGPFDVRYHNGPVVAPAQIDSLADYEPLAVFRTEVANNGAPPGVMVNSPAIAAGRCGQGRVLFISPHPEQTPGLEDLVLRAAVWASGRPGT